MSIRRILDLPHDAGPTEDKTANDAHGDSLAAMPRAALVPASPNKTIDLAGQKDTIQIEVWEPYRYVAPSELGLSFIAIVS